MQLRKLATILGICALSAPAFAQVSSSASGSASTTIGATGVNETAGQSSAGVKAQGSGSAEINANRPGMPDRATGVDRADQRRADRAKERHRSHARRDRTADTIPTRPYPGGRDANGSLIGGIGATTGAGVGVGVGGVGVGVGANAGGSVHGNPGDATGTK